MTLLTTSYQMIAYQNYRIKSKQYTTKYTTTNSTELDFKNKTTYNLVELFS